MNEIWFSQSIVFTIELLTHQMNSSAQGGGISLGILESSSKNPFTPNTMVSSMVSTCGKKELFLVRVA